MKRLIISLTWPSTVCTFQLVSRKFATTGTKLNSVIIKHLTKACFSHIPISITKIFIDLKSNRKYNITDFLFGVRTFPVVIHSCCFFLWLWVFFCFTVPYFHGIINCTCLLILINSLFNLWYLIFHALNDFIKLVRCLLWYCEICVYIRFYYRNMFY